MIEIPIGKALIAVKQTCKCKYTPCNGCYFNTKDKDENCEAFICATRNKKGKINNIIFKLVDINSHYIDGTIRKPIRRESDEQL